MSSTNETVVGWRRLRNDSVGTDRQKPNRQGETVGNRYNAKEERCLRLISQNINGIGQEANNEKELGIKNFITDYKVDIMSLQQLNVC